MSHNTPDHRHGIGIMRRFSLDQLPELRLMKVGEIIQAGDYAKQRDELGFFLSIAIGETIDQEDVGCYFRPLPPGEGKEGAGSEASPDASRQEEPAGPKWTCVGCGNTDPAKYRTVRSGSPMDPPEYDIECDECGSNEFEESPLLALRRVIDHRDQLYGDLSKAQADLAAGISPSSSHPQGTKAVCEPGKHAFPVTGGIWGKCRICGVSPYATEAREPSPSPESLGGIP
jgi:hypothetical protein